MSLTTRIFHFLARMPLPLMQRLGAVLGWVVWWLSPSYRRHFKANVQAAGLKWRDARPAVAAIGSMVAELPWVWMRPHTAKLDGLVKWDGAEHFEAAMQAGKGVIIMSPHLGAWEIGAQAIADVLAGRLGGYFSNPISANARAPNSRSGIGAEPTKLESSATASGARAGAITSRTGSLGECTFFHERR